MIRVALRFIKTKTSFLFTQKRLNLINIFFNFPGDWFFGCPDPFTGWHSGSERFSQSQNCSTMISEYRQATRKSEPIRVS